jgi:O-antigen/teichoic acid export membrane protein
MLITYNRLLRFKEFFLWTRIRVIGLAVLDQGLFSGFNFISVVLLARWMPSEEFGAYSYVFSVFLLLAGFHSVLIVEPLNIYGPARYKNCLSEYISTITKLHWILSSILTVAVVIIGAIVWMRCPMLPLGSAFIGFGISQGFILYFWLQRRTHYMERTISRSLIGTIFSGIGLLIGIIALHSLHCLTSLWVFILMGSSAFFAGTLMRTKKRKNNEYIFEIIELKKIFIENWRYGRWLMLSTGMYWLTTSAYLVLTGSILTLNDAGSFRAIQNLASPILQINTAMGLVFMPWLSSQYAAFGQRALRQGIYLFTIAGTSLAIGYMVAIWIGSEEIIKIIYGNKFLDIASLLPFYCLLPVIYSVTSGWLTGLRVLEKTNAIFAIDAIGAFSTLTFGVLLVYKYGISGAIAGTIISSSSRMILLPKIWRFAVVEKQVLTQ